MTYSVVRWHISELLSAGFHIESIRGRKGGYILKNGILKRIYLQINTKKVV